MLVPVRADAAVLVQVDDGSAAYVSHFSPNHLKQIPDQLFALFDPLLQQGKASASVKYCPKGLLCSCGL